MTATRELVPIIRELHQRICTRVVHACESQSMVELSSVDNDDHVDTIFIIDAGLMFPEDYMLGVKPHLPHSLLFQHHSPGSQGHDVIFLIGAYPIGLQ